MATNFLEELIAEWYEYQGYFIRRNINVGLRKKGGYECELDIVAFHPEKRHLVHIEASTDASSWEQRDLRFKKKFDAGQQYIPSIFSGLDIPSSIEQYAVLVFASKKNRNKVGGKKFLLASELLIKMFKEIGNTDIFSSIVPEQFSLLRCLQFVYQNKDEVWKSFNDHET